MSHPRLIRSRHAVSSDSPSDLAKRSDPPEDPIGRSTRYPNLVAVLRRFVVPGPAPPCVDRNIDRGGAVVGPSPSFSSRCLLLTWDHHREQQTEIATGRRRKVVYYSVTSACQYPSQIGVCTGTLRGSSTELSPSFLSLSHHRPPSSPHRHESSCVAPLRACLLPTGCFSRSGTGLRKSRYRCGAQRLRQTLDSVHLMATHSLA